MTAKPAVVSSLLLTLALVACTDKDGGDDLGLTSLTMTTTLTAPGETSGDGDGDGDSGDGDGAPGDGDGDGAPGDGDGAPGDGDGAPGDGDGEPADCGADPGWGAVAIGQPVKHVAALDHTGAMVNVCDWAGTPMVWDIAAMWCGPCQDVSAYLATGASADPFSGLGPSLRSMIESGTGVWLTFLVEDVNGGPASTANAAAWDSMYHHANIPVLNGLDTQMLPQYLQVGCWPTAWIVAPDMTFHGLDDCATWNQLQGFINDFGG